MKEETIYNANNILAFNLPTNWFASKANEVFTEHLQKTLRDKITKLHNINKQLIFKEAIIPKNGINEILLKFKEAFEATNRNSLTNSELRTLTYYIDHTEESISAIFSNQEEVNFLINILLQRWKDSFFIGIFSLLLKKWNSKNTPSFNLLYEFLTSKNEEYIGNRKLLLNIKNNNRYFEKKNGITRLINTINDKNIGIGSTAIADFLELPVEWFSISHEYFENLVFDYCEKKQNKIDTSLLKEIGTILTTNVAGHYFNKKILCRIIKYTYNTFDEQVKEEVKQLAFTYIGDPAEKGQWLAWVGANEEEATELELARRILNEWITTQFIIVFFEKCINDERRKAFWLKMSKHISSFKVFGPERIRKELRKDQRIGDFVKQRFKTTGRGDGAAFLMVVQNYQLIEFSDHGNAFYAYQMESAYLIDTTRYIESIENLKRPDLGLLLYANGVRYQNGKLIHNNDWEQHFAYWLRIQLNINVNL